MTTYHGTQQIAESCAVGRVLALHAINQTYLSSTAHIVPQDCLEQFLSSELHQVNILRYGSQTKQTQSWNQPRCPIKDKWIKKLS